MEGAVLSLMWALPFAGLLLSIALGPLLTPYLWHHHYGKVSVFWIISVLGPMLYSFGLDVALQEAGHIYGEHFLPFIILLITLYVLSAGLKLEVRGTPTPLINTLFLGLACVASNFLGTVGSAMIFIRPFLSLIQQRQFKTHSVIFFIFLVCNIGGSLTVIGDPPLFIGFLLGVDFFWPLFHLMVPFLIIVVPILALYFGIDHFYLKKEGMLTPQPFALAFQGWPHVMLLVLALSLIILSGWWHSDVSLDFIIFKASLSDVVRDIGLLGVALVSYHLDGFRSSLRPFEWGPMEEVAKLFAGIFMTAAPVIAMLKAGKDGPFAPLIEWVTYTDGSPISVAYFWISGVLSAFLDNAPTYLIFFNLVGAPVGEMMTTYSQTLMAISMGSVFMGALTYIGNAPNFMVKSIAETHHISMPSFFAYMIWSGLILLPLFFLLSFIIF